MEQREIPPIIPKKEGGAQPGSSEKSQRSRLNFLRSTLEKIRKRRQASTLAESAAVQKPPDSEKQNPSEFHPPAYNHTLEKIQREAPDILPDAKRILDSVDKQGEENFTAYEPEKFPGVQIPNVKISVNQVAQEVFGILPSQPTKEPILKGNQNITFVSLPSFLPPPDGSPYFAWNVAYERVVQYLPKIVSASKNGEPIPQIDIIIAGNPYNELSAVTGGWVKSVARNGFATHGETYARLTQKVAGNLDNSRVILFGPSMGAPIATQAARFLPDVDTQILLENPAGVKNKIADRAQALPGFVAEGILTGAFSAQARKDFKDLHEFTLKAADILREKGTLPKAPEGQGLKYAAALADIGSIVRGTNLDTANVRSFIYRGMFDPTGTNYQLIRENFSKVMAEVRNILAKKAPGFVAKHLETDKVVKGKIRQAGHATIFPVSSSHGMERLRLNKWKNIINYCRSATQS